MKMSTARRARTIGPAAVLAGVAALALGGVAAPAGASPLSPGTTHPHVRNGVVNVFFPYTGAVQTWLVPSGVYAVTISALGAAGEDSLTASGGNGALETSSVPVFPGETLYAYVGGTTGFNGGGTGPGLAGNGGGASDVSTSASLADRLIVAGGGGGAGDTGHGNSSCASPTTGAGGDGGDAGVGGSAGTDCNSAVGGDFGDPGTLAAGGAGGTAAGGGHGGATGSLGNGGDGGDVPATGTAGEGGGGGGGYYGGGGGASGGVNGAVDTGGGGGGGGGSSFGQLYGGAVSTGNGQVTISYSTTSTLTIDTSSPLPGGTKGQHYSTTLAASGGTPGYTWSLIPGSSLPAGLSLSSGGVISGTPTGNGTKTFTVEVRDSVGNTADKTFSLTIGGTPADLAVLLSHEGMFRHDRNGRYQIEVANTNTSNTSLETHVALLLPSGITVVQGGKGTYWQCHKQKHSSFCARNAKIDAHSSTTITVKVKITAAVGKRLKAKAIVSPSDSTPGDNTSYDFAIVHNH